MKKFLLTASIILNAALSTAGAQNIYSDESSLLPGQAVGWLYHTYEAGADVENLPGDITIQETYGSVGIPLFSNEKTSLVAALRYRYNQIDLSENVAFGDLSLHSFEFPFTLNHVTSKKWAWRAQASPGYWSDLEEADSDAFNLAGFLGGIYTVNEDLKLLFGAVYSRRYGDDRILPGLGLHWKPHDDWFVNLTFPIPRVEYAPAEGLLFSVFVEGAGGRWNTRSGEDNEENSFILRGFRAGVTMEKELGKNFWFYVAGGLGFGREIEIQDVDEIVLSDTDVDSSGWFRSGVTYRF